MRGGFPRSLGRDQIGGVVCAADWTALRGGKEVARAKSWAAITGSRMRVGNPARVATAASGDGVGRRKTLPQGLLGQAIDYTLKRWEALNRFVDDGVLEIDNNLIENSIRPSALGKKNWLFVGHPEAGERSAVIYTCWAVAGGTGSTRLII
jgi:hypothetical protein